MNRNAKDKGSQRKPLTRREIAVMDGAANGETSHLTAARLKIGVRTVEMYRTKARGKLGAENIARAVVIWVLASRKKRGKKQVS